MDDTIDSVTNENQGVELYQQLSASRNKAGMFARKWLSNSENVLNAIPKELRMNETDITEGVLPSTKTLGILWQADHDNFRFHVNKLGQERKMTKKVIFEENINFV